MNTQLLSEHLAGKHRDTPTVGCRACDQIAKNAAKPKRKRARGQPDNPCECGCGTLVHARFAVGHDAKLKSRLINQAREGATSQLKREARNELRSRGWLKFL
jgi:hypothetical protein